ncbi:MAG: helix-turn-helix transcriptional regulator [Lachnospiraceae bacterium]|nr:helix-turn-helix transcriptional regulator [Lachnospiraceae bacterium]
MTLAEKIALLRKQKGWSQEELADKMDISRQSVSKWESGQSVPDLDKIIKISDIFAVSTDYLLKEEGETEEFASRQGVGSEEETVRSVSIEEADAFMGLTKKFASIRGIGTGLFVLSPVCLLILGGISEYDTNAISEEMAGGLGLIILLLMVAIGVIIMKMTDMQLSKYEYLEKEKISLGFGVKEQVLKKKEEFEKSYRIGVCAGIALIFAGIMPLMAAVALDSEDMAVYCVPVILLAVAVSVYCFVRFGSIWESYEKLLQEGDYTKEKKELKSADSLFSTAYWCIVTAIYLGISFIGPDFGALGADGWMDVEYMKWKWGNWGITWVIWPVAAVLFAGLKAIFNGVRNTKRGQQDK